MTAIPQDVAARTGRTRAVRAAVARTGRAVAAVAVALVSPHKAALGRLVEIPLTVVGVGCVEHLIADPEPTQEYR